MADTWTIRRVLAWTAEDFTARSIDSPRLDAELLVAHALGCDRMRLYLDLDRPLREDERGAIRALVVRRRKREPVAYILGHRDFHGIRLAVDPRVLIPRPDTEVVVERALAALHLDSSASILDVCTGSGAIPLAILSARAGVSAVATDCSAGAAEVAAANAVALGLAARFEVRVGNLADSVPAERRFDVVTANPPYVESAAIPGLMPEVASFEPRLALDGGADGFALYPALVELAAERLNDGGLAAFEVGIGQADRVAAMFEELGAFGEPRVTADYGGVDRVVEARRRPR